MDFITPFIGPITSCLWDPLMKQTSYLKAKSNKKKMRDSIGDLKVRQDNLQKKIEHAEREQKQSTNEVKSWLQDVSAIENKVEETIKKYESIGLGDCSLNCWSTYKFGKEAATLLDEMVRLQERGDRFDSITTEQNNRAIPIESTVHVLDGYVEMVNYLNDDNVGVIGINGMGGVGKTTLLKKKNNSLGEDNLGFEYLIWVVVSREFQLTTVQAQVAMKLNLQLNDKDDTNENASIIFNYLKDKNFLLMLDDIWKEFNIVDVGIPDTHCGSSSDNQTKRRQKVILTSRFKQVCGSMRADRIIKVECLDTPDARNLFKKTLGEWYLEANPGIHRLVEEAADKCAGLPLALVVIARAMSARNTIQEWQEAIMSLKKLSRDDTLLDEDLHLFSTLRFSYDSLKNDALRKCFLFCSLWPEDVDIEKDEIIAFWIGIELIKDYDTISRAFDKGHLLIEDLKGACLLESGSDDRHYVKMHDVLRDLALWIVSDYEVYQNKWLVKAGIGLREVQLEVEKWQEAQVVSLMNNLVEEIPPIPFECPNIAFLMLQWNQKLSKIDPSIFQNMCALTSLSLQGTRLLELPESIGMLTMLLYLDLSNTEVYTLPKGLGNLTKLRYLGLRNMEYLECIPAGVISSLEKLQVFDLRGSTAADEISIRGPEADENEGEQSEETFSKKRSLIDEVKQLPGGLKGFGVNLNSSGAFKDLSILSRVFTWHLKLFWAYSLTTIDLERNMWSSLESLELRYCKKAKELVFDADEGTSNDTCPIKELRIYDLCKLTEIIFKGVVPSAFFQRLHEVEIGKCDRLRNINWILGLQSLASLTLESCKGIDRLVDDLPRREATDEAFFLPSLSSLRLICLPDLRCICRAIRRINFPKLEELYVRDCPKLQRFLLPASNNNLRRIDDDRERWNGLEVEESIGDEEIIETV